MSPPGTKSTLLHRVGLRVAPPPASVQTNLLGESAMKFKGYEEVKDRYRANWREEGVGCRV